MTQERDELIGLARRNLEVVTTSVHGLRFDIARSLLAAEQATGEESVALSEALHDVDSLLANLGFAHNHLRTASEAAAEGRD